MPSFCRHNRLVQNCPICAREQSLDLRPIVSSGTPGSGEAGTPSARPSAGRSATRRSPSSGSAGTGLRVRRLARGADDGYRSTLLRGLRSSEDAGRLAAELAFSARRLDVLRERPPGLYAEVAEREQDIEERIWLAFLIAYLCPLDEADPFAEIARVRTTWASEKVPQLHEVRTGPRSAHDPSRGTRTLEAYRAWSARAGSQAAAFAGEPGWLAERRFARTYERLALPGLHRAARFDLLLSLGALGVFDLAPGALALGGGDEVTVAAKRALGIGDPLLLERRAQELASACRLPLGALDLGFYNWERGERAGLGVDPESEIEPELHNDVRELLQLGT